MKLQKTSIGSVGIRTLFSLVAMTFSLVSNVASANASEGTRLVRIGIVTDGPNSRENNFVQLFKDEMEKVAAGSYEVDFPTDAIVHGAWSSQETTLAMDRILAREDLDAVVAVGIGVAAEVCGRERVATPVVVPFAFGGCATTCSTLPEFRVRTLDLFSLVQRDLKAFHELTPFDRVTILMDPTWPEACGAATATEQMAPESAAVEFLAVDDSNSDVVQQLPPGTDAVYLMPLLQLDDEGFDRLVASITEKALPSFSMLGESEVDRGVLAGINTRATMSAFARGSALEVLDLLDGRVAGEATLSLPSGRLTLNMATASALGFSPSWEQLTQAKLLHDDGSASDQAIDLATAIQQAVQVNLDLVVRERRVAAGAEDLNLAKSAYRPHLDLALSGVVNDENHAIGALGQYSRFAAGSATLTQLIYSDAASGNISIQGDLQRARELDWQALRLDIARDAVAAYMNVLRTDALIGVRQEQVDLTRTNLELARTRRSLERPQPRRSIDGRPS